MSSANYETVAEWGATLAPLAQTAKQWSVLITPAALGAQNMALDHALLHRAARTGGGLLRLYTWSEPTLSFGRHQTAAASYDRDAIRAAGLAVVRRPTGGRAVLHDHEITYSVTAPLMSVRGSGQSVRRARARELYTAINRLLVGGLRRLGIEAAMAARPTGEAWQGAPASPLGAIPCFDVAAEGEVVARGRKLIGSAQWREEGAVLQHGSILVADDQHRLADLGLGAAERPRATATLTDMLGRAPTVHEVAEALRDALDNALEAAGAPPAELGAIDTATRSDADGLSRRYMSDAWTWRR